MGSRSAIYNDIAPRARLFFVRGQKCPRERPERTACCPRVFFVRGRKKTEVEAAISLYIARRDPIYIINIPFTTIILQLRDVVGCGTISRERFTNLNSADRIKDWVFSDGSIVS